MYNRGIANRPQRHERRRPKCGTSNQEAAKPHEESLSNSTKNQDVDGPTEEGKNPANQHRAASIAVFDAAIRKFSYRIYSSGEHGEAVKACDKREDSQGRYGKRCSDTDRCYRNKRNP